MSDTGMIILAVCVCLALGIAGLLLCWASGKD